MLPGTQDQTGQVQGAMAGKGGLENRLRGMILNNSTLSNTNPNAPPLPPSLTTPALPPHMLTASPADQQQYLDQMVTRASQTQKPPSNNNEPQQTGRKRLNQAQRRQMNSQLSIPVDTRHHQQPGLSPSARGFTPYSAPNQTNWSSNYGNSSPQFNTGQRFQNQQPYSPRFPQPSPASPYTTPMSYQSSPRSGTYPNQPNQRYRHQNGALSPQAQPWQNTNQTSPGPNSFSPRPTPQNRQLYQPGPTGGQGRPRPYGASSEEITTQGKYLDEISQECLPKVEIDIDEANKKEEFRALIEKICRSAIMEYEQQELGNDKFDSSSVELKCYGSLSSGFATKGSDMDLALLTPYSHPSAESPESPIPRLLEQKLLSLGYGARLLTRTRIPIIKLCQQPTEKLMADLREERSKWEQGFVDENDDIVDDKHVEVAVKAHANSSPKPNEGMLKSQPAVADHIGNLQDTENKSFELKQRDHQSLNDYYMCAKRVLRKHGGRDLTVNSPEPTLAELTLLRDVCKAFILGLSSQELSTRLQSHRSISPLFDSSVPFVKRSLNGIFTQIEGERLAMGWDERPLLEATDKNESECCANLEAWKALQNSEGPVTESEIYNRQLHNASERLKKSASLQLVFLEQMQYENPQQYLARVLRLKSDLTGRNLPKDLVRERKMTDEELTGLFISRYISGIHNSNIREELQSMDRTTNLLELARKHQILQLISDYEHAIEAHLFNETDQSHIEEYIVVLRNMLKGEPSNPAHAELLSLVRTLPDPTQISLNKPKDRYKDHLEFPKNSVGIQCDINFSNHLALHNTLLLRLYSACDPRVKVMVLFVKHWAKLRGINTPYRGTLGSYGYVLMVLHYLVNIVHPPVCPNLQLMNADPPSHLSPAEREAQSTCDGHDVRFWRDEAAIRSLADKKMLSHNHDSVGILLRGFFEYFAQGGQMTTVPGQRGFDWGREVLSLRTKRGLLSKQEKGWVGARTVVETTQIAAPPTPSTPAFTSQVNPATNTGEVNVDPPADVKAIKQQAKTVEEVKEIRHRYLFAIEDPFEIDHNIARTVTHNGIVSIRDEFRRAWGIIKCVGTKFSGKDELLEPVPGPSESRAELHKLLDAIHGVDIQGATSSV
jgi:terminal uridylyltransferase